MRKIHIPSGAKFGSWTVLAESDKSSTIKTLYQCVCSCGREGVVESHALRTGRAYGCRSCAGKRIGAIHNTPTHGSSGSITYSSWGAMKVRCKSMAPDKFKIYRGRGIAVCERWEKFENFLADMGERPSLAYSIDRINNDGNYEPGNCRWATRSEQQRNRRPYSKTTARTASTQVAVK